MAVQNKDEQNPSPFFSAISITCFLTLAILLIINHFFFPKKPNNKKLSSCYLNNNTKEEEENSEEEPQKPQYKFKRILSDNSYSLFKHLSNEEEEKEGLATNVHPYKGEISKLIKTPNVGSFSEIIEKCGKKEEMRDSYVWVDTEEGLRELVEVLSNERVFGVDTEQHSLRSFLGFTSLVQISTLREDYLVDTIILHDVMGLLRPVFANPGICKVFHGADNDVLWLQRDFHIYIVNLFDTAKACDVLSKPQRSLAYLLETYCGVTTNKFFQREDWRQRPLSEEMIQYARTDAHYLLFIAYCLCMELKLQKTENSSPGDEFHFILEASRRSNATSLQLFGKDVEACPGDLAASSIISRCLNDQGNISSSLCDAKFQGLVRRLCLWRDIMARLHDESLRFVLSDNAIIALAAKCPTTEIDICSTISIADMQVESTTLAPLQSPSPVVTSHFEDLVCLFHENTANLENMFLRFIQQHLGQDGSCPLSAYNYALLAKTSFKVANRSTPNNRNGFRASKQGAKRTSRQLFVQKFSCKSPVYHNCKIYASDGRLLCYCDRRKLEWYISRNLAKLVEEDPLSIMLLFEPKGRPEDEDNDFYIQSKKNICVGCGEGNHYLRYRIIPSCYRMHFPEHLKSHRSHDIVLVCVDCHEIAHAAAEKYKRRVADEFGIPLFIRKVVDSDDTQNTSASSLPISTSDEVGVSPLHLRTAAMALLRHGPQMPSQRREELMQIVMKYYGGREISDKDLERALVVGMTPHERRRFEKKRGFTFKHLNVDKQNKNGSEANIFIQDASTNETEDSLYTDITEIDQKQDYDDSNDMTSDVKTNLEIDDISGSEDLPNATSSPAHVRDSSLKQEPKLSLLGHGPHGKLVIEYLLKEHGEEGVRDFCQRWRQVFVEAVHPRFLPGGWDVLHSGKRDFGEFSVYNPTKKLSGVAAA